MNSFINWLKNQTVVTEAETRYSVEINYRSRIDEVLAHYAKLCLGYACAGLKKLNFHCKQVFEEHPYRILISSRNWDDGEWVGLVSWNPEKKKFILSKGFFNKDRKSVSVQHSHEIDAENAAEIVVAVRNLMHNLKNAPDRHTEKLKRVPLKRGPK